MRPSLWIVTAAIVTPTAPVEAAEMAEQPNVLIILADDLCWRDLGCTGNADVKTPNIDRLAAEGMTLSGMFTPAPTCSPCRHALYTGLYPVRSGAYPNHTRVDEGTASVFTHLKALGYRVALQGKTHVKPPGSFPYEFLGKPDDAAALAKFVRSDRSKPWFAVLASNNPHTPWSRGDKSQYPPDRLTVPPYLHDNETTRDALSAYYAEITKLDDQVGSCLKILSDTEQADNTLVLFLSEQGSAFPFGGKWSLYDNGIRIAAFARWPGKIEPCSKSGALMQYVDVAPTLVALAGGDPEKIDTGCPNPAGGRGFDGRDFTDVLFGKADRLRDHVFAQHTTVGIIGYKEPYPMRAVRDRRYKLIRNLAPEHTYSIRGIHEGKLLKSWQEDATKDAKLAARVGLLFHRPGEELYDLEADPFERKNLAGDPKMAEVKARLSRELDAWMRQQGDEGMATEMKAKSRQGKGPKR